MSSWLGARPFRLIKRFILPTINQLVSKGREYQRQKTKSPALRISFNSLRNRVSKKNVFKNALEFVYNGMKDKPEDDKDYTRLDNAYKISYKLG